MRKLARSIVPGRRVRAVGTGLALLAASLTVVAVAASPSHASCAGSGVERPIDLKSGSTVYGRERTQVSPQNESCGNNGVYYGRVQDSITDGSCVRVRFQDPIGTYYTNGVACTTNVYSNFTFWDQTGDSWALINVCTDSFCYYNTSPWGTPIWNF